MPEIPSGVPISSLTFAQLQQLRSRASGWSYPKKEISKFIPLFSGSQRTALNLYGWIAIFAVVCGAVLSFVMASWWWLLLSLAAYLVWKANRKSMEQFFLENLQTDPNFFEQVKQAEIADFVFIIVRTD